MKLTDTHCHLYNHHYDDINEVLNDSKELGVDRVINNACDIESFYEVLELSKEFNNMYVALGFHPGEGIYSNDLELLNKHVNDDKVVAIGEIGLDYFYTQDNKKEQQELFRRQLEIAEAVDKPVIIHSREATQDVMNILKEYKVKGVIHSFSGSLEVAKEYIKMGFALGVGGVVTFKNCNFKEVLKEIKPENILIETDSPYLTPEPNRGKKNMPGYAMDTARFVANIYHISVEELISITNENIKRIFDI